MAISTYSELKTAISDYMARSDLSGNVADFIRLAEARLNRLLNVVETDATLTGIVGSRTVSVSSLSIVEPVSLHVVVDGDEERVSQKADGQFEYREDSGQPSFWAIDGTNIDFDCPLDEAYSFRFRYQSRFALSDGSPTNKLLTEHPDVYLAASIVWGGLYIKDDSMAAGYKGILDEFIAETRHTLAQSRRGVLTVDPGLTRRPNGAWDLI